MKTLKKTLCFFLLIQSFSLWATERIENYQIDIFLSETTKFLVKEKITYHFDQNFKHGIYRDIPVLLKRLTDSGFGKFNANYKVNINVNSITNEQGTPRPYKKIYRGGNLRLRIGSPRKKLTGLQVYEISYQVERAINEFKEHDEFYWNTNGNNWQIPINNFAVRVHFPLTKSLDSIKNQNFFGYQGAKTKLPVIKEAHSYYWIKDHLKPHQGLSILFSLPKGFLKLPTRLQKLKWFLRDNLYFLLSFFLPLVTFFIFFLLHRKFGRDPFQNKPITVQYTPPDNLSPAEVGTIIDEKADIDDLVATIVYLASLGFIKIHAQEKTSFLFLSKKDYRLEKLSKETANLSHYHHLFLDHLFNGAKEIQLSDLKNKFYKKVPSLKEALYQSLLSKRIFAKNPEAVRSQYLFSSSFIFVVIILMAFFFAEPIHQKNDLPWIILGVVIASIIATLFSKAMPKKTRKGAHKLNYILGLKEFIQRVEQDRIQKMHNEDPSLFGNILPYAIVLGLADEWADKFNDLLTDAPHWYSGVRSSNHFIPQSFVHDLGEGLHTMASTFVSQPTSSGSGGSSGFGGGGGFSGGGFGGGGGGSW